MKGDGGMRVYELMNALSELPSGAEVRCWLSLTVDELESGIVIDDEDKNNVLYEVAKPLDSVDNNGNHINLCF